MPRAVRLILIFLPLALALAAIGVWVRNTTRESVDARPSEIQVKTESVAGIAFEVEHEMNEGANLFTSGGPGHLRFTRRGDILDYQYGLLTINEIGLPDLKSGDTVRWNLTGPLLVNGQPVQPHPLQARSIEAASFDGTWDAQPSPYPRDSLSLAWAGVSRKLVVGHGDGVIRVWDADTHQVVKMMTPDAPKTGGKGSYGLRIDTSPDGKTIVAANMFGEEITIWDLEKGEKTASFNGDPKSKVRQVAFASDTSFLEARGDKLRLRSLNGMAATELGTVHEQFAAPFAVHPRTGRVAWTDGKLHFGPIAGPTFESEPMAGDSCFAFSPDGSLLAAFNGDNRLSLLDPTTGKEVKRLRWRGKLGTADGINTVAFAPDGKTLAVGGQNSIRLYDVPTGRERGGLSSPWVRALAYSADGRTLAAGLRYQPGLRLWETADLVAK